ncbi:MAG: hypothetical protein RLZZ244_2426 [Verrucomicrobiota bacterium]
MSPKLSASFFWVLWVCACFPPGAGGAPASSPESPGGATPGREALRAFQEGVCAVFEGAAPAVVVLEVEMRGENPGLEGETRGGPRKGGGGFPEGDPRGEVGAGAGAGATALPPRSEGSGFVVRSNGVILTNHHVVAAASRITVRLRDGRRFVARLLGADERTDVAVLQIEANGLAVLAFADSDRARVGQWVAAVGAPFSQEWSFTTGILSGKGRSRLLGPSSNVPLFEDYLQTDAFISPGHSGGPLLDLDGRVLGMNTLIARSERGLAFAVPSNMLAQTLAQILEEGRVSRPWLGVRVETLGDSPSLRERLSEAGSGAVILAIEPDGPGYRTDLRPADVIQAMDGVEIRSGLELQRELFRKKIGQTVQLRVWRAGGTKVLKVETAQVPDALVRSSLVPAPVPVREMANERFGLGLREVKARGVRVESVEADSLGARAELRSGDVITDVEGRRVRTTGECLSAIRSALSRESGAGAILQIERQGRRTFVLLRVP